MSKVRLELRKEVKNGSLPRRFKMRYAAVMFACLAVTVVFLGCKKEDKEQPKEPEKDPLTYEEGVVINGVKWATRNVDEMGTFTLTPESAGNFYQWNRKKAWNTTDSTVSDWDNTIPEGTKWEKMNDPSPAGWRVPTFEEIEKLLDTAKVMNEWITKNGASGRKFTDKANGNTLFFPAVGYRGSVLTVMTDGLYWSNTQYDSINAYYLVFGDGSTYEPQLNKTARNYGFSVRSVVE